jgi:hypothetical protein
MARGCFDANGDGISLKKVVHILSEARSAVIETDGACSLSPNSILAGPGTRAVAPNWALSEVSGVRLHGDSARVR